MDLSNCPAAIVENILRLVPGVITAEPLRSILVLADFSGAMFSEEALRLMKEAAVFDKSYIKKTAWVGAEDFSYDFLKTISSYALREFPRFRNREEVLEWLVRE